MWKLWMACFANESHFGWKKLEDFRFFLVVTPPKFNSSPLKNDGWKITFLLGLGSFSGDVRSFLVVLS